MCISKCMLVTIEMFVGVKISDFFYDTFRTSNERELYCKLVVIHDGSLDTKVSDMYV